MSKFKIINLIDKLFVTITIFLIVFAWVNFYLRDLWITFTLSLIFTSSITFILFYCMNKKNNRIISSNNAIAAVNDNFLYFKLLSKKDKLQLLKKIYSIDQLVTLENEFITFVKDEIKHIVLEYSTQEIVSQNDLYNIISNLSEVDYDVLEIISNEFAPNINTNILKDKKIELINKTKLYNDLFLKYDIYPDHENIQKNINKVKLKDILKSMFKRQNSKPYFFSGLILIFSSIILPYHAYYIVIASMLLLFSLICRIYPKISN